MNYENEQETSYEREKEILAKNEESLSSYGEGQFMSFLDCMTVNYGQ